MSDKCKAALNRSTLALLLSCIAAIYSTWYLPGLIQALNNVSEKLEKLNNAEVIPSFKN